MFHKGETHYLHRLAEKQHDTMHLKIEQPAANHQQTPNRHPQRGEGFGCCGEQTSNQPHHRKGPWMQGRRCPRQPFSQGGNPRQRTHLCLQGPETQASLGLQPPPPPRPPVQAPTTPNGRRASTATLIVDRYNVTQTTATLRNPPKGGPISKLQPLASPRRLGNMGLPVLGRLPWDEEGQTLVAIERCFFWWHASCTDRVNRLDRE